MAIRLHIGAGASQMEGWINADLYPAGTIDLVFDLEQPWPLADGAVEAIYGSHVLEHLTGLRVFFDEAWRVLDDQGTMLLRTPFGAHRAAWWDVTHIRPWFAESFCSLQPGYDKAIGNPQHRAFQEKPWQIDLAQMRVAPVLARWLRWKLGRRLLVPRLQYFTDVVEELFVQLRALKSVRSVEAFQAAGRHPATVPVQYVIYAHELAGTSLAAGEPLMLSRLGMGEMLAGYRA